MPALQRAGIVVLNHAERNEAQRDWVAQFFEHAGAAAAGAGGAGPVAPVSAGGQQVAELHRAGWAGSDAFGRENPIAIVKVPRALPRVIRLPDSAARRQAGLRAADQRDPRPPAASCSRAGAVESFSQFRVTRDSDLDVDEDDVTNLRQALRIGPDARATSARRSGWRWWPPARPSCRSSC